MMNLEQNYLIEYLNAENCSCVIRSGNEIRVFYERGVKDLYRLLKEEPGFLSGAFVADKVVGKAAAALMILGEVKEIFANILSRPACELLEKAHVRVEYMQQVTHIINRMQTGWCPLEAGCLQAKSAEECLPIIEDFIENLPKLTERKE